MVSFSKLPGMVGLCIVVLISTLAFAAPVRQDDDDGDCSGGLATITEPIVMGIANPLLKGAGMGLPSAAANAAPAVDPEDTVYVQA